MDSSNINSKKSISGKSPEEIRKHVFNSIILIKDGLVKQYTDFLKKTSLDHVKRVLAGIVNNEREDIEELKNAMENKEFLSYEGEGIDPERDIELIDHLIEEEKKIDCTDLSSIIKGALRVTNDLLSLIRLMIEEYPIEGVQVPLKHLLNKELDYKRDLEDLYEELVEKEYW